MHNFIHFGKWCMIAMAIEVHVFSVFPSCSSIYFMFRSVLSSVCHFPSAWIHESAA